jgi:peroxiredoxin
MGQSETVRRLLRKFSEIYSEFVSEEAQVLAVVQGSSNRAERLEQSDALSLPVLADEDDHAHLRVGVLAVCHVAL